MKADYGLVGGRINLHGIWDGYLAERAISTPPSGPKGLLSEIPTADRASVAAGTVTDWSREAWQVSHDVVYATAMGDPCGPAPVRAEITEAKIEAQIPIARKQIVRAGLRLGRMLNEALD